MTLRKIGHGGRGPVGVLAQGGLMERTAVLRLDAEWTKVRAGRAAVPPGERERMLLDLISALAPHAANDLPLTARLSLRYADLARHHFDAGRRVKALRAVAEAVRHCAEPARHDEEHARWYARALLSQSVYLAEPLSDELGLPRYAFPARGERPPAAARADGIAALEATRRAMAVWEGLPGGDPRNREGLAQSRAFLGDRLEELGDPVEAVVWAVRAEQEFHALGERPGAPHGTALEHLGDQLVRRLRRCGFQGGLTRLRAEGLLPGRLLPLAVVAARVEGVEPEAIARGLRLAPEEVRRVLRARCWRAVWRFDVRERDGAPWTPMPYPWRGMDAVTDRSAAEVAAELTDALLTGEDRPPDTAHWRIAVWWEDEGRLEGACFRRTHAPRRGRAPRPGNHPDGGLTPRGTPQSPP
ncbi:hypothetical protein [Streptomyces clavuligerus]|nr:hypothetical protein [Streptomyces clavuligerus]MBY6305481.1 hypothetical protein [Streptomyces clavuligerus]QPL65387.1 hypothetical protein I3J04_22700 [Streptomyces clavuligerus]QPL71418.1 hypothetical protein I3J05_22710 [Streptomyces clavuligerus]QPL77500.1 hypothetical protein I3J06_22715 [Streptomyces clavuligerus]QPL83525.1 hypothetical protein I3J07_22750 [Streptomyces clavuligerus]